METSDQFFCSKAPLLYSRSRDLKDIWYAPWIMTQDLKDAVWWTLFHECLGNKGQIFGCSLFHLHGIMTQYLSLKDMVWSALLWHIGLILCFVKRREKKWNLFFAKRKSVLCEIKFCTLRKKKSDFHFALPSESLPHPACANKWSLNGMNDLKRKMCSLSLSAEKLKRSQEMNLTSLALNSFIRHKIKLLIRIDWN